MWARVATLLIGLWLMAAPGLLDFPERISDNGHIVGPLIIAFSIIAMSECTRNVCIFNLPLGAWLLFAPWILSYENNSAFASDYIAGVLTVLLSLVKQPRKDYFAGGWSVLWK